MIERIDIHDPLTEICERLGLEPEFVREMFITPVTLTVKLYAKNGDGKKHADALGAIVLEAEREYQVKT